MASVSLSLHSKKYSDGTRPVMLQCVATSPTGTVWKRRTLCRVLPEQWDAEKGRVVLHPNRRVLNALIEKEENEAKRRLIDAEYNKRVINPDFILNGGADPATLAGSILAHGRAYVERLALQKQTRTAEKYSGHLNRLGEFLGKTPTGEQKDVALTDVTEAWLLAFSVWLQAHGCKSPNTLHRRMAFMGTLLHDARKRGLISHEPMAFLKFKEQKVSKLKLSVQQIQQIEQLQVTGKLHDARNAFLMQLYAYGARIGDALTWRKTDLQRRNDGLYLSYRSQKTGDVLEVRLNQAAQDIVASYQNIPGPYLLPWLQNYTPMPGLSDADAKAELYGKVESATTIINGWLKRLATLAGIQGKLTTHVARHSFATLADTRISDKRKISAALGHKRFSTTEVYLSDLRSDQVNDAMDALWE